MIFQNTMATMTATQIAAAATRQAAILLPIGVIEAHGPHLPTGTDAFLATQISQLVRRYATREFLVAPPYYWGINSILRDFTGSFRIRPETAALLLTDVLTSLIDNGFPEIYLISHHGDLQHNQMILTVLTALHAAGHQKIRWLYAPARDKMIVRLGLTGTEPIWVPWTAPPEPYHLTGILGVHADEVETAGMVRYFPDTVDYDALKDLPPTQLDADDLAAWRQGAAKRLTPDGYFGAPNPIDPDLWRHFDETAKIMAEAIK